VRLFLEDLRRFSSSLVTIESKFMTVAQNWIQEIGVDFRGIDSVTVSDVTNGLEDQASRGIDNGGTGTQGTNAAGAPGGHILSAAGKTALLIERPLAAGRVLLSAVPLDSSWGSNLPDLPSFVPLAHELVYHLAGARSAEHNLAPGRPLRFEADGEAGQYTLTTPGGEARRLSTRPGEAGTLLVQRVEGPGGAAFVYEGARESGVYTLRTPAGAAVHYVIPPEAREGDLSPLTKEMRARVDRLAGVRFAGPDDEALLDGFDDGVRRQDLWLYLLLGLTGLLCLEVWMTRRLVMSRG